MIRKSGSRGAALLVQETDRYMLRAGGGVCDFLKAVQKRIYLLQALHRAGT